MVGLTAGRLLIWSLAATVVCSSLRLLHRFLKEAPLWPVTSQLQHVHFGAVLGPLIATEAEQTGPVASAHSRSSDSSVVDSLWEMFAARLTVAPVRLEKLQESEVKLKTLPSKSLMRCMCKASGYYHCLSGPHSQELGEPRTCRQESLLWNPQE